MLVLRHWRTVLFCLAWNVAVAWSVGHMIGVDLSLPLYAATAVLFFHVIAVVGVSAKAVYDARQSVQAIVGHKHKPAPPSGRPGAGKKNRMN
jgi:hypothetical protein